MTADTTPRKQHGRPFAKGQSGNPKGRPKGSRHKALQALDAIGQEAAQSILQTVIAKAQEGDMTAARILMDRVYPIPRGRTVKINLPAVHSAQDVPAALARVIEAVARGELSLDEAASLAALLKGQRETDPVILGVALSPPKSLAELYKELGAARELTDEQLMAIIQGDGMRRPTHDEIRAALNSDDY